MEGRSLTEYVVLGALIEAPRHGYEIKQFLGSALESTWRVSTSQLYALLRRLTKEGLIRGSLETQKTRPSKRVFTLTGKGEKTFRKWLHTPVAHVRNFRMEFLTKMFFLFHYSMPGARALVDSQIKELETRMEETRRRSQKDGDPFSGLVFQFKIKMMESLCSWLATDARAFAGQAGGD
jgi:DNA-binding PadR family transcriptional regulator